MPSFPGRRVSTPYRSARARTSCRAASAMCSLSMPAAASSSAGFPERRHADDCQARDRRMLVQAGERREHGFAEAALRPVVLDGHDARRSPRRRRASRPRRSASPSSSRRRAPRSPRPASASAAASASPTVMPAPTIVTSSSSDERSTRLPPTANSSSGAVDDRRRRSGRPQVGDALQLGHRGDELRRLVRRRTGRGRCCRRRPASWRDPRAPSARGRPRRWRRRRGSRQSAIVAAADGGHADEVVGAGQEGGEGGGERLPARAPAGRRPRRPSAARR